MEVIPRTSGRSMGAHLGRVVHVIVDTSSQMNDAYGNPAVKTTDGVDVTIQLPPGERLDGAFVQIEGKVVRSQPLVLEAQRVVPVTGNFDVGIYNQAMDVAGGKYNYLFTA